MKLKNNFQRAVEKLAPISLSLLASLAAVEAKAEEALPASAQDADNLSLGSLFALAEAEVVSSSKTVKKLKDATAVITVWTAEDIRQQRIRSISELLDKTPGFFTSRQFSNNVVGSRGMIADDNAAYLLLIDGHATNSIAFKGMDKQYIFPTVENIKRVEIVRGPGSTLWGSDAALGIIHIITKTGTDINGLKISSSQWRGEGKTEVTTVNSLSYGAKLGENQDIALSYEQFESQGFSGNDGPVNIVHNGDYRDPGYQPTKAPNFDMTPVSYQMYGKIRIGLTDLKVRSIDYASPILWGADGESFTQSNTPMMRRQQTSFELSHTSDLTSNMKLESKMFGGQINLQQTERMKVVQKSSTFNKREDVSEEQYKGAELMLVHNALDNLNLKYGARYVETDLSPMVTYEFTSVNDPAPKFSSRYIPEDRDKSLGIYSEAEWGALDNVDLVFGGRIDHNNLREKGSTFIPRFGTIYQMAENLTFKYLYNTGYVRPPAFVGILGQVPKKPITNRDTYGADKSEIIEQHDLQLLYAKDNLALGMTLFQTRLENYFQYSGTAWDYNEGGVVVPTKDWNSVAPGNEPGGTLFVINAGNITSRGVELQGTYRPARSLQLQGDLTHILSNQMDDFSYSNDRVPVEVRDLLTHKDGALVDQNKELLAVPKQMWNLGINWNYLDNANLNLHYRGQANVRTKFRSNADDGTAVTGADRYTTLKTSHYIDIASNYDLAVWGANWEVGAFVKNVFDHHWEQALAINSGVFHGEGRVFGLSLSSKF